MFVAVPIVSFFNLEILCVLYKCNLYSRRIFEIVFPKQEQAFALRLSEACKW
jgi:hypothetical protein